VYSGVKNDVLQVLALAPSAGGTSEVLWGSGCVDRDKVRWDMCGYSTVQHSTAQCSAVRYSAVQCSILQQVAANGPA
jgi:hypothetical protein